MPRGGNAAHYATLQAYNRGMNVELLREVKAYWDRITPSGVTVDDGLKLMRDEVKRYEAALLRIAEKPDDGSPRAVSR